MLPSVTCSERKLNRRTGSILNPAHCSFVGLKVPRAASDGAGWALPAESGTFFPITGHATIATPTKRVRIAMARNWASGDRCRRRRDICRESCAIRCSRMPLLASVNQGVLAPMLQPIIDTAARLTGCFLPEDGLDRQQT